MLVVIPYNMDVRDNIAYSDIARIASQENIDFYNFFDRIDDIEIDVTQDYNDQTHLNYWGSVKFSAYLGQIITEDGLVSDRRGQSEYKSWDDNATLLKLAENE